MSCLVVDRGEKLEAHDSGEEDDGDFDDDIDTALVSEKESRVIRSTSLKGRSFLKCCALRKMMMRRVLR